MTKTTSKTVSPVHQITEDHLEHLNDLRMYLGGLRDLTSQIGLDDLDISGEYLAALLSTAFEKADALYCEIAEAEKTEAE